MQPTPTLKVGDKIVDYGHVYRIFQITKKGENGSSDRILHFRPYYNVDLVKDVICSIPESGLTDTTIRLPIEIAELRELVLRLSVKPKYTEIPDAQAIKDTLNENDPSKLVDILRILWSEKRKEEGFTKSKSDLLELAKTHLVQEAALIWGITLENAQKKVETSLDKPYKK